MLYFRFGYTHRKWGLLQDYIAVFPQPNTAKNSFAVGQAYSLGNGFHCANRLQSAKFDTAALCGLRAYSGHSQTDRWTISLLY